MRTVEAQRLVIEFLSCRFHIRYGSRSCLRIRAEQRRGVVLQPCAECSMRIVHEPISGAQRSVEIRPGSQRHIAPVGVRQRDAGVCGAHSLGKGFGHDGKRLHVHRERAFGQMQLQTARQSALTGVSAYFGLIVAGGRQGSGKVLGQSRTRQKSRTRQYHQYALKIAHCLYFLRPLAISDLTSALSPG